MMPVIAFGCAAVIYVYLGLEFGFNYKTRGKEKVDIFYEKNETDEIELRFQFDAEGFIDVQAFRKSVEEIDLNDDKPEFSFKLEGLKD